jgi:hypothetical protein
MISLKKSESTSCDRVVQNTLEKNFKSKIYGFMERKHKYRGPR